jgi:hypothetical protein
MSKNLTNINRFSETKEVAKRNARIELDEFIPLIPDKVINFRPSWVSNELKRLKKSWKFDVAAKLGENMFKGAFPAILKRYEREYMTVIKLS